MIAPVIIGFLPSAGAVNISGANSMIVLLIPLAFASIPNAGAALLMYMMSLSYAAMQISPTHICLAIITEYFDVSWGSL